ncbi:DUF5776 domain-containing protein [Levilactobacillus namurensis]|uniref:DUF5776 domain-containing protein n=1 Tax=Levilactobacillus namurensis TaxID=380393 RepID=UPI0026EBDFCE|nr:DUF5776 domain-containing protein [Levilactobacillus namurensis]
MRRIFRTFWSLALGLLLALGLSFLAPTSARASTAANLYGPAMVNDAKAGKTVPILLIDDNDQGLITPETVFSTILTDPDFKGTNMASYPPDLSFDVELGNNAYTYEDIYALIQKQNPTMLSNPQAVQNLRNGCSTSLDQFRGYVFTDADQQALYASKPEWSADHQALNYYMQAEKSTATTTAIFYDKSTAKPTTIQVQLTGLPDTQAALAVGASRVPFDATIEKMVDATGTPVTLTTKDYANNLGITFPEILQVPLDGQATHTYTILPKADGVVLVHYQYANGKTAQADQLYHGPVDSSTTITAPVIDGYTPDQAALTPTFTAAKQELTFTYQKDPDPVTSPASSSSSDSESTTTSSDSSATSSNSSASNSTSSVVSPSSDHSTSSVNSSATTSSHPSAPTTPTSSATTTSSSSAQSSTTTPSSNANQAAFKPFKLYVKHNLYAYRHPTFKTSQRVKHYVKRPRVKAQALTVVGTARSKQGLLRYQLANGTYITAQPGFVANLYWQGIHSTKLTVTNPKGAYLYRGTRFTQKNRRKFLKPGTTVKVKQLVHHGMTTRYQLTNGQYLTGNKRFVSPVLK